MKMPAWKYKGISLEFIPSGYLRFVVKEQDKSWFKYYGDEDLIVAIEKELKLRDLNNDHFWEDKINVN